MLQKIKKQQILYTKKGIPRSRFLVNLTPCAEEELLSIPEEEENDLKYLYKKRQQSKRLFIYPFALMFFKLSMKIGKLVVNILRFVFFIPIAFLLSSRKSKEKNLVMRIETGADDEIRRFCLIPPEKQKTKKHLLSQLFKKKEKKNQPDLQEPEMVLKKQPVFSYRIFLPKFSFNSFKICLVTGVIFFVAVLPFKGFLLYADVLDMKGRVLGVSEDAVEDIKSAGANAEQIDFSLAEANFKAAGDKFSDARKQIGKLSILFGLIGKIIPGKMAQMAGQADDILDAGRLSARIGEELSSAFLPLNEDDKSIQIIVENFSQRFKNIEKLADELGRKLDAIDAGSLPEEYQAQFKELQENFEPIILSVKEVNNLLYGLKIFLGFDYDKRYLIVFQNNTELRATGGFIGSYALLDFSEGKIKNIEVPTGGSYDTEGGMMDRFIAPEPLHLVNPFWHFWDANWWPDWTKSAKKLEFFYEKSSGPSVDGVLSLTPTVIERLLKIIGPIDMGPDYENLTINSENFWDIVQTFSEQKPKDHPAYTENKYMSANEELSASSTEASTSPNTAIEKNNVEPKKIIGDLADKLIPAISERMDRGKFIEFLNVMEKNLAEKQILLYFKNNELGKISDDYNFSGRMKETDSDYLSVVHTNIAGGKSDKMINDKVALETEILQNGQIENTLSIKRTHSGVKGTAFSGVRNVDWLRVYVPEGSEMIFAEGFTSPDEKFFSKPEGDAETDIYIAETEGMALTDPESGAKIYKESGKTVFAGWLMVDPGKSITARIKYRLPFRLEAVKAEDTWKNKLLMIMGADSEKFAPYSLLWQKQAGTIGVFIKRDIVVASNFQKIYSRAFDVCSSGCELDSDKHWGEVYRIN